ncbi:MAG TPA: DJ-1/PfpI family protein [Candidatus Synoicihabitans sp.]|nr:DJ-1/PfpI family protein [Candidatus Synoicihabitans sp.]
MKRNVAILIFDDVEVLDFAGPYEVFAVTDELRSHDTFQVVTVAPTPATVRARNGLKLVPDFILENCPAPAILIIPGGAGTRALLRQPSLMEWLRLRAQRAEVVMSVCTGALVLGKLGLLDGRRVTTHHENLDELAAIAPAAVVDASRRFHDHLPGDTGPRVLTAAGISAGIDASLYLVGSLLGRAAAERTARYMEYGDFALSASVGGPVDA